MFIHSFTIIFLFFDLLSHSILAVLWCDFPRDRTLEIYAHEAHCNRPFRNWAGNWAEFQILISQ